jgi:hypothetical protein
MLRRRKLLAPSKNLKILSVILIVAGVIFTVTVVLAIAGIPFAIFGVWMWRFSSKNIAAVELGYAEYVGAIRT